MTSLLSFIVLAPLTQDWKPRLIISVASQPDLHPKMALSELQNAAARKQLYADGEFHPFEDRERRTIVIFHETVTGIKAMEEATTLWKRMSRGTLNGLDPKSYIGQEVRRILEGYFGGSFEGETEEPFLGIGIGYYIDGRTIPGRESLFIRKNPVISGRASLKRGAGRDFVRVNPGTLPQSSWSIQALQGGENWPGVEFSEVIADATRALSVKQDALMTEFMRTYRETIQGYVQQDFPELAPHVGEWVAWNSLPGEFQGYVRSRVTSSAASPFRSERAFREWEGSNPRVRVMPTLTLLARLQSVQVEQSSRLADQYLSLVLAPPWERELPDRP